MSNSVIYAVIMLLAGMGIPTMAAINSGLGVKLQSTLWASSILLLFGLSLISVCLLATKKIPSYSTLEKIPVYFYLGGFFLAFYIFSITRIAPHLGIANAIAFVLLGQLIAMTVIDHFGCFGMPQIVLTPKRFTGLLVMGLGVFLVLQPAN